MGDLVVNMNVPKEVAERLQQLTPEGVEIESAQPSAEQTSRFGVVEVTAIVGLVKGIEELVKLALEIRNLLKEHKERSAEIHAPGSAAFVEILGATPDSELEARIREHFLGQRGASV